MAGSDTVISEKTEKTKLSGMKLDSPISKPHEFSKYNPDDLPAIAEWAREGLRDIDICKKLGIGKTTLYSWKRKYPEIKEVLTKNKETFDAEVENALAMRALGYSYVEVIKELVNGNMVVVKEVLKSVPPDVTAQIFWLKNRQPGKWRDKHEIENTGKILVRIGFDDDDDGE